MKDQVSPYTIVSPSDFHRLAQCFFFHFLHSINIKPHNAHESAHTHRLIRCTRSIKFACDKFTPSTRKSHRRNTNRSQIGTLKGILARTWCRLLDWSKADFGEREDEARAYSDGSNNWHRAEHGQRERWCSRWNRAHLKRQLRCADSILTAMHRNYSQIQFMM